jgi:hypothetical protein
MNRLSITTAWNETSAFLKANFGSLLLIILAFQVIPSVALQFLMPMPFLQPGVDPATIDPAEVIEAFKAFLPFLLVLIVLSFAGTLAVMALVLRHGETVGEAIAIGFRRLLPFIGALLLVFLALILLMVPISLVAALSAALSVLLMFLIIPAFIFVMVRLLPLSAVAVAEPVGPVGMLRRSWQLTSGYFWKLLGFTLLLGLVFIVLSLAITLVFGGILAIALGAPEQGSLSQLLLLLVGGAVNGAFAVVYLTMIARIYTQLSPTEVGTVFD